MKTPEEIKKGLRCCTCIEWCAVCPYEGMPDCATEKNVDAIAYIQRLERERDTAVAYLADIRECSTCRYDPDDPLNYRPGVCFECCTTKNNYEWRGVPEKEGEHGA